MERRLLISRIMLVLGIIVMIIHNIVLTDVSDLLSGLMIGVQLVFVAGGVALISTVKKNNK